MQRRLVESSDILIRFLIKSVMQIKQNYNVLGSFLDPFTFWINLWRNSSSLPGDLSRGGTE